eukprot:gene9792-11439_t
MDQVWKEVSFNSKVTKSHDNVKESVKLYFANLRQLIDAEEEKILNFIAPLREKSQATVASLLNDMDELRNFSYNTTSILPSGSKFSDLPAETLDSLLVNHPKITDCLFPMPQSPNGTTHYNMVQLSSHIATALNQTPGPTSSVEIVFEPEDISAVILKAINDVVKLETIDIVSSAESVNSNEFTEVYLLGARSYIYTTQLNSWKLLETSPFANQLSKNSVVSACGNIYQFGGENDLNRFNIFQIQPDNNVKALNTYPLETGLTQMSSCYDGQKYIYLVGGYSSATGACSSSINRIEAPINQFQLLSNINMAAKNIYCSYIKDTNSVLYWCGVDDAGNNIQSVNRYDIDTAACTQLFTITHSIDSILGSCFDGKEFIYILTPHYLLKLSIKGSGAPNFLKPPPHALTVGPLSHIYSKGSHKLYHFASPNTMIYDIATDTWQEEPSIIEPSNYEIVGKVSPKKILN